MGSIKPVIRALQGNQLASGKKVLSGQKKVYTFALTMHLSSSDFNHLPINEMSFPSRIRVKFSALKENYKLGREDRTVQNGKRL